ncbi:MAG: hypothetical protein AAGF99_09395 [Bacteroidota bacterium]
MSILSRTFFVFALLTATSIFASQGAVKIHLHGEAVCSDSGGLMTLGPAENHLGQEGTRLTCSGPFDRAWNDATAFDRALYRLLF